MLFRSLESSEDELIELNQEGTIGGVLTIGRTKTRAIQKEFQNMLEKKCMDKERKEKCGCGPASCWEQVGIQEEEIRFISLSIHSFQAYFEILSE